MSEFQRIYMDHNATTPIRREVAEMMRPYIEESFGNPSSAHSFGTKVRNAVEKAREQLAGAIEAESREIIFTSGGTEADNLALLGVAWSSAGEKRKKIVTSAIEHPAVYETARFLDTRGFDVVFLPVDGDGIVDLEAAKKGIDEKTLLVSVMLANNEIGSIEPVRELAELATKAGALMHSDCVQALGKMKVNVRELGVDLASFSAHKIYGPKGAGAIYISRTSSDEKRSGIRLAPMQHGGHQERRIRPGTENPAGIIGFGKAAELAEQDMKDGVNERIRELRNDLERRILQNVENVKLNGATEHRVPNTLNLSFAFVEGESILMALDQKGIAVSTGSACSSGSLEPSHVLVAMGLPHETAHGSIRFSLGRSTTEEEVVRTSEAVVDVISHLRSISPFF
jgi:cysteine desulfurase